MRWLLIVATALTLLVMGLVVVVAQPQAAPSKCTWVGTPDRDVKTGTSGKNVLCSLQGQDFVHGQGGNDRIRAGRGRDTLVGGSGRDTLRGGGGQDRLFAVDDASGELVVGGPGKDQCFVDPSDTVRKCEEIFRSDEPQMATALDQSLGDVMEIVEEVLPSITPTLPPPGVTITKTVTIAPGFCNEEPPDPPAFC
jgi:hypothetical protein